MLNKKGLLNNIGIQVVIAMIIGTLVGATMGQSAVMFAPLGTIFINLIKMLVIPLVAEYWQLFETDFMPGAFVTAPGAEARNIISLDTENTGDYVDEIIGEIGRAHV